MATRLNAQLLKASFGDLCPQDVVYDPTIVEEFSGRILVAAGWKPGFSTDNDAVLLAERFGAKTVVNLSNIEKVYTDDPRKNLDAKPLDTISWADFRKMVGDEWVPGKNCPFDPIASKKAESLGMKVICAGGKNIPNIKAILNDEEYIGTTIA
jgi:uridylate kinase